MLSTRYFVFENNDPADSEWVGGDYSVNIFKTESERDAYVAANRAGDQNIQPRMRLGCCSHFYNRATYRTDIRE